MTGQQRRSDEVTLSVVIAAFNASATLGDQLDALLPQCPQSWEIVISDNGSTDDTPRIVADRTRRDPRVRLVDASARRGPAAARNIGVAASRARLIAFCDADDVVGAGWADAVSSGLAKHPFIAGRFDLELLRSANPFAVSWSPQLTELTHIPYMAGFVTAGAGNMAMRREVFETIGGFDESTMTAEDDDLCLRAQIAGFDLVFVPDMLLHVRKRTGLIATFQQSIRYGEGARQLEHKFARVAAELPAESVAHDARHEIPAPAASGSPERARRESRMIRRVRPSAAANLVWRIGWRLGYRRARLDTAEQPTLDELRVRRTDAGAIDQRQP